MENFIFCAVWVKHYDNHNILHTFGSHWQTRPTKEQPCLFHQEAKELVSLQHLTPPCELVP